MQETLKLYKAVKVIDGTYKLPKVLEGYVDVMWSFFHFIYKTLNHVKQLYPFEIISVDGNFVKLLVVDPKRVGYLEIDFHFNGEEESRLLKQFEEET